MKYFGFTCTVGAIAEAVYDAIEPILNELKGDINTMKIRCPLSVTELISSPKM